MPAAVSNRVRERRAEMRLSQERLAALAGTTRQTVLAVETGGSVPSVALALRIARALDVRVDDLFTLAAADERPRPALVVAGSDDPGLALFAERLRSRRGLLLSISPLGSTGALESVAAGVADLGGIHFEDNVVRARAEVTDAALIHFARREQGLAVRSDRETRGLADLDGLRVALRQKGSGTRALFERIVPSGLALRVALEAGTHDEVAAAVLRGDADAGTTIRATAVRFGLAFVPLAWERFDLVLRRVLLDDPRVRRVQSALAARADRDAIVALGGYDCADSGTITLV